MSKVAGDVALTAHPLLALGLNMGRAIPLPPLSAFLAWNRTAFSFYTIACP